MELSGCATKTCVALCGREYIHCSKTVTFHRLSLGHVEAGSFEGSGT